MILKINSAVIRGGRSGNGTSRGWPTETGSRLKSFKTTTISRCNNTSLNYLLFAFHAPFSSIHFGPPARPALTCETGVSILLQFLRPSALPDSLPVACPSLSDVLRSLGHADANGRGTDANTRRCRRIKLESVTSRRNRWNGKWCTRAHAFWNCQRLFSLFCPWVLFFLSLVFFFFL